MDSISIILKDMTFIGLVCLQDPPRKDVTSTINKIRGAGVKIIMVTGDQETTALSIARQCDIVSDEPTVNQLQDQMGYSSEQAFQIAKNIVITGQ